MGSTQEPSREERKTIGEVASQQVVADMPAASSPTWADRLSSLSLVRPTAAPVPQPRTRDCGMSQRVQRARAFTALASLADERGLRNVTATQVIERAGISRKSFYQLFADFDECLRAALQDGCTRITAELAAAYYSQPASWRERVRAALSALLAFLDADPLTGRLCVVGALGANPDVLRWREWVLRSAARTIDRARDDRESAGEPPRLAGEAAVGTVLSVLHSRMVTREPVSGLLNELMALVVLPYLGASAAERELRCEQRFEAPKAEPREHFAEAHPRLTYRTLRVLQAVAHAPGASNRQVADAADIVDGAQISRLLARLRGLELVENESVGTPNANAWRLTPRGEALAALSGRWLAT